MIYLIKADQGGKSVRTRNFDMLRHISQLTFSLGLIKVKERILVVSVMF